MYNLYSNNKRWKTTYAVLLLGTSYVKVDYIRTKNDLFKTFLISLMYSRRTGKF